MRIVSLLPSLTELVCSLGRGDGLVGVTHECDFPTGVERLPHLTRSRIPEAASGAEIDALVSAAGGGLYELDRGLLAELRPDLILTQEQCDVCAVNEATVRRAALALPGKPEVESVNPTDLAGVFAMFRRVGVLLGAEAAADAIVEGFRATTEEVARRTAARPRPRAMILEWVDPPFSSGHWNPEIVDRAGGSEVVGRSGERSARVTWADVDRADPEVILVAACGFSIDRAEVELTTMAGRPEWRALRAVRDGRVAVTDGSAYFSRPGPRLEASLRIASAAIDPDRCGDLAPPGSWRMFPARA